MPYLKKVQAALVTSLGQSEIYAGKAGALRLAREIGSTLNDCDYETAKDYFDRSYNEICVIGYNLNPPVNKVEWDKAVLSKWKRGVKK